MGDLILPPVIGVIARVDAVGNIEKVLGRADLAPIEVGGDVVGIAKETTLASINGKTPSLTAAGNVPIAISEDIVNLLKEAALRAALKDEFALGVKPETDYNSTTLADDAFLTIVPPSGQYVYLMCITANVGTDGDVVELQVLDVDGVTWHTVDRLKMLANTSRMKGYPNLKLDKVKVAGVEKSVMAGDGTTATVRLVSRGSGPWEASIQYFCAA